MVAAWLMVACQSPEVLDERPSPYFGHGRRPVDEHGQLAIRGGTVVDQHGHPVQLRGVSTQWLNWEQTYATSLPALEWLRDDWGLSVIRVANGVEHASGYAAHVDTRRAMVDAIVQNAIDAGVYVIVDWHTHQIHRQDLAEAFFDHVASTWGHHPNVLYETFNEPNHHDWTTELRPYHTALIERIRSHDPDNLIIVGTPEFDQRPDRALPAPVDDPHVAYALHFYACSHQQAVRAHGQAVLDAGHAIFVSEWGSMFFEGGLVFPIICHDATAEWLAWMEAHHISGTAWKLSSDYDLAGMLEPTAPVAGGWSDRHLGRHGRLVRDWIREGVPQDPPRGRKPLSPPSESTPAR